MSPDWDWLRQTPGRRGTWDQAQFAVDQFGANADCWVVYDDLPREETIECAKTILVTPEPPAHKRYDPNFTAQFDLVITSHRELSNPNKTYSHQGLPWHVGRLQSSGRNISFSKDYDELKAFWPIAKTKEISVIASDKAGTPGHRARRDFVEKLKSHFGNRIDFFGWGGLEIPDKWDAIAPYRYHIAIENSACPDYWTEKLSDAYLAGAFPIYHGCPNITDYFPKNSVAPIPLSISAVESVLNEDPARSVDLKAARELVLDRYNLFAMLSNLATPGQARKRTLQPAAYFYRPPGIMRRALNKLRISR